MLRALYPVSDVDLLDAYHLCGGRVVTFRRSPESNWVNNQNPRINIGSNRCCSASCGFSEDPQADDDPADVYWSQQQREKEKGRRDWSGTTNSSDKVSCGDSGITLEDDDDDAGVASTAGTTGSKEWCGEVNLAD